MNCFLVDDHQMLCLSCRVHFCPTTQWGVHHLTKLCFSLRLQHPGGPDNLWDLVSVVLGLDDSMLPETYPKGIMHMKHLVKYKAASILFHNRKVWNVCS